MTRRAGEAAVAGDQRRAQRFGKSDISGIVGRKIVSQIPDAEQQRLVGIPMQGEVCQIGDSRPASLVADFAPRHETAERVCDLDVEQMWRVQGFAGTEQPMRDHIRRRRT